MKTFSIEAVLSVMTGASVTRKQSKVVELVAYMTNSDLLDHEIDAAFAASRAALVSQFPQLAAVAPPAHGNDCDMIDWIETLADQFGAQLAVSPIDEEKAS